MKEYFVQAYANAEKALEKAKAIAAENGVIATPQIIKGQYFRRRYSGNCRKN